MKKGEIDADWAMTGLLVGLVILGFVIGGFLGWSHRKAQGRVSTVTDTISYKAWTNTAEQLQRLTRRVEILEEYSAYKAHADGNFSEIVLIPMYASSNAIRTNLSTTLPHSGPMLDGRGVP